MKKLFYLMFLLLLMPMVINAEEIEVKSIEANNDYKDVEVLIEDSKTAVINFTVDRRNFTEETAYKLVISNNTDKTYDLNLEYLNTDTMKVTTDKSKLSPGENTITLTVNRTETDMTFASSGVTRNEANIQLSTTEKENPNTGSTIITSLVVASVLVVGAILLYSKTNKSSSFYLLLLLLVFPGIIIGAESKTIKIKINTIIDNTYEIRVCSRPRNNKIYEMAVPFDYSDFYQTIDNVDIIAYLTGMDPEEYAEILEEEGNQFTFDLPEELENIYVFRKSTVLEELSKLDLENFSFDSIEEGSIVYNFVQNLMNTGRVAIYDETDSTDSIIYIYADYNNIGPYSTSYSFLSAKVSFNKNGDKYLVEVPDKYAEEKTYVEGSNPYIAVINRIYASLDNKNYIPVIDVAKYIDKIKAKYPKMVVSWNDDDLVYELGGTNYNEANFRNQLSSDYYYGEYGAGSGDPIKYAYYTPAALIIEEEFRSGYIFASNGDVSRINATNLYLPGYIVEDVNPNLGYHYAVMIPSDEACYRMPIHE